MEFDGAVLTLRQFVPPAECVRLESWALSAVAAGQFVPGISRDARGAPVRVATRVTNRICPDRIDYPPTVYALRRRIEAALGLTGHPPIEGHGRDGVVCSVTYDGGDVYAHTDPTVGPNRAGLRCNVLARAPDGGGTVWVSGVPYTVAAGDLMCYRVTERRHRVEPCRGGPRVMFMFGWCVPAPDTSGA